jgi:hypothetical protein
VTGERPTRRVRKLIPTAQTSGAGRLVPLGSRTGNARTSLMCAVCGVGDVVADGLHESGDGRTGRCRVEDVDVGRRFERQRAIDVAVRDRGPRLGLRSVDVNRETLCSLLESHDLGVPTTPIGSLSLRIVRRIGQLEVNRNYLVEEVF